MARLVLLMLLSSVALWSQADILVVAHPSVSSDQVDQAELADIFLKRHATLRDGSAVIPVNRAAASSLRQQFEAAVMADFSPRALAQYWQKQRFRGIRPPLVQDSTSAALLFVSRVEGAITYIEGSQPPQGVKLLLRLRSPQ